MRIKCSCGFEGEAKTVDEYRKIGKVVVICPKCSAIHIVRICKSCGVQISRDREYCEDCGGCEDKPVKFNHLTRTEAGMV